MNENLIVSNYKEPLKKVEVGFGYFGALSVTEDGAKVQCHICGGLFVHLGRHVFMGHQITSDEYREKFQLAKSTGLVSEKLREQLSIRAFAVQASKSPEVNEREKKNRISALQEYFSKEGSRANHFISNSLETKNKRGNCPEQLKEKAVVLANLIGRTPSREEFKEKYGSGYFYGIIQTFGSWRLFIKESGLEKYAPNRVYTKKYDQESLLKYLRDFKKIHGRYPNTSDMKRGYIPRENHYYRVFGSFTKAKELAAQYAESVLSPLTAAL